MLKQKRARGRLKKNWMQGIRKAMNERNLKEGQWEDRKQWSLGVGQRRKSFETDIYIYIPQISYSIGTNNKYVCVMETFKAAILYVQKHKE